MSWNLRQTGITLANDACCGQEEHQHTEECILEKVLICGFDEEVPTEAPTEVPTEVPTEEPTEEATAIPSDTPAETPTEAPTETPTETPTEAPTEAPTETPTEAPTEAPTETPTEALTETPTETPSEAPTEALAETTAEVATEAPAEPPTQPVLVTIEDEDVALSGNVPTEIPTEQQSAEHIHSDECYEIIYLCNLEEHIHTFSCYSDTTADIESAAIWEAGLPEITDAWAEDLVRVAQSQLGCKESERNYLLAEDGVTRNGITRYGQWYGNPHGDWSAMFILFCLNYAEIPQEAVPWSPGVYNMMRLAQDVDIFRQPDDEAFQTGNLLFLDTDANGNADRVTVVTGFEEEEGEAAVTAIGGDWENTVAEIRILPDDDRILGYVNIQYLQTVWESEDEPESTESTENADETTDQATIFLDLEFPEEEGTFRIVAQTANIEAELFTWQWQVSVDGNEPWMDIEGATELVCELEYTEENFSRYYRLQGHRIPEQTGASTFALSRDSAEVTEDDDTITSESISPFSITKNNGTYTIDVYHLPVDTDGNRITELPVSGPSTFSVTYAWWNNPTVTVKNYFDTTRGEYVSAYFGTSETFDKDNIESVKVTSSGSWNNPTYTLTYRQTGSTNDVNYLTNSNTNVSLYMRYKPLFTITLASEEGDFTTLTQTVPYDGKLTLEEPSWSIEGYTLLGWTIDGNEQTIYTYEELMQMPVTSNVTYLAKWANKVTVSFDLGAYADALYPIEPMDIPYNSSVSPLPSPIWQNNTADMAFDGWYLDQECTQQVTAETQFTANTTIYAKWVPKDEGYFVYFMDFEREGKVPLVLSTYSVTEGGTVSPYTPGNVPEGKEWDGKWYLDDGCTMEYNFSIPVSDMTEHLTGANNRDLYLHPGMVDICRAIFVTYGTKVDPITVNVGGTINLDAYIPQRDGYSFAGWMLADGTPVSGAYPLTESTTFYAQWEADYVPFEACLRIENANDTDMALADILGTWYAKAGSHIRVKSTYTGTGTSRKGTHEVVCILDGVEYDVFTDANRTKKATLDDVYSTYFLYNNTGTNWTDAVDWDEIYTGGQLPYSTRPISSAGDTIINFDYMRVRNDIVFTIPNTSSGGYIDIYKLQQSGLITGSVIYSGTTPTSTGQNVSASGVSAQNISWSYTATASVGTSQNNYYTLHNVKYGQRIYEVYPVGGSWLTARSAAYHQYAVEGGQYFSSRRQDLTSDFFSGSGRALKARSLTVEFKDQEYIALMYAVECLVGEAPDFTHNGVNYKVVTELCEVVKHTGYFSIKSLDGCEAGVNMLGTYNSNNKYYTANTINNSNRNYATSITTAKIGNTSVYTLFNENYWPYYEKFNGVENLNTFAKIYIFCYNRLHMNIQFNFGYDSNGNGSNEIEEYSDVAHGEKIGEYQYAMPDYEQHGLLNREGYEFKGWLDANGFLLEQEDWESMVATGDSEHNTMIFMAKWEKISNNIVEYYEGQSSTEPFESHYFEDGELVPFPTMAVYPEGWLWQEYGEGLYQRFDWNVPMYGEYGVQEVRVINGEERVVNVIRIYGTWDDTHTKVAYDPNVPQGGIPGTAPTDSNEYTIWQSSVPVAPQGGTANSDPNMIFAGWELDRNGIVYQPGDHVPVHWPRTMIFTAQWAKAEDVVYLRYDPNGGTPEDIYPSVDGFAYAKNASASVWANTAADGNVWFTRSGYKFTGWNTEADGSGTSYAPDSVIVLTEPLTTLYAQWERTTYNMSLHKTDLADQAYLAGAEFGLYKDDVLVQSSTTGVDGHISFPDLEIDALYKLVEERAPDGYGIITKEIFFRVQPDGSAAKLVFYDAEGNVIAPPNGVAGEYITGDRLLTLTVQNLRGLELPATGGIGFPFYILIGLILILAPFVYGLSLRRRYRKEVRQ